MFLVENQNKESVTGSSGVSKEVPSVLLQTKAHPSRSDRYSVLETGKVIQKMEERGFKYEFVSKVRARGHNDGYQPHLIYFENPTVIFQNPELAKDVIPRLYLRNSFNGQTKAEVYVGLYRQVCKNGLQISLWDIKQFTQKHIGTDWTEMNRSIDEIIEWYNSRLPSFLLSLRETRMSEEDRVKFAELVMNERLRKHSKFRGEERIASVDSRQLLTTRREEDKDDTLWNVLNRVQENLGLNFRNRNDEENPVDLSYEYEVKDENGVATRKERRISRPTNISEVIHLNKFLFNEITKYLPSESEKLLMAA